METITITHRIINGKNVFNKRFDDYDKGYYGLRINRSEYEESKQNADIFHREGKYIHLDIIERICYKN